MYPRFRSIVFGTRAVRVSRTDLRTFIPSYSLPSKVSQRRTALVQRRKNIVLSPHSRLQVLQRDAQGTPTQRSAAHTQCTASVQGYASFHVTYCYNHRILMQFKVLKPYNVLLHIKVNSWARTVSSTSNVGESSSNILRQKRKRLENELEVVGE
ncbi:hypothetical protein Tco_0466268 [Tanacetum coccineum]